MSAILMTRTNTYTSKSAR